MTAAFPCLVRPASGSARFCGSGGAATQSSRTRLRSENWPGMLVALDHAHHTWKRVPGRACATRWSHLRLVVWSWRVSTFPRPPQCTNIQSTHLLVENHNTQSRERLTGVRFIQIQKYNMHVHKFTTTCG